MNIKIKLGKHIKEVRLKKGLTQQELAEKLNIASKHQSRIETGKSFPSAELLEKYAQVFNITTEELLKMNTEKYEIDLIIEIYKMLTSLSISQLEKVQKYINKINKFIV